MFQEVLLKRAADLVEALYGMPHNNQVNTVMTIYVQHRHWVVDAVDVNYLPIMLGEQDVPPPAGL